MWEAIKQMGGETVRIGCGKGKKSISCISCEKLLSKWRARQQASVAVRERNPFHARKQPMKPWMLTTLYCENEARQALMINFWRVSSDGAVMHRNALSNRTRKREGFVKLLQSSSPIPDWAAAGHDADWQHRCHLVGKEGNECKRSRR